MSEPEGLIDPLDPALAVISEIFATDWTGRADGMIGLHIGEGVGRDGADAGAIDRHACDGKAGIGCDRKSLVCALGKSRREPGRTDRAVGSSAGSDAKCRAGDNVCRKHWSVGGSPRGQRACRSSVCGKDPTSGSRFCAAGRETSIFVKPCIESPLRETRISPSVAPSAVVLMRILSAVNEPGVKPKTRTSWLLNTFTGENEVDA